ncbi:MAG: hypothetical protein KUG82_12865 [Pseudomonadales bacterium]|nr:hypothetical protein [Pseudomonadales bacterium]
MSKKEESVSEFDRTKFSSGTSAQLERKAEYVLAPTPYTPENEMSLVDLIRVVLSHKLTLFAVFSLTIVATLLFVLMMPKQYNYETVIELGSYMLPNEKGILSERKLIESLDNSKSKLEKRFITQVLNEAAAASKDLSEFEPPKFKVSAPKNGNLLILSTLWREDGDNVLALETKIANNLIQDHIVLADEILEQARQHKDNYKLELKELTASVMSIKQEGGVLSQRLARTEQEAILYSKQIQRLDVDVLSLVKQKAAYISDQTQPKEAMAILLLDNELKQIRDHRDRLEVELLIQLENRKADLRKALADNASTIEVAQANVENVRNILVRFHVDNVIDNKHLAETDSIRLSVQRNQFQLVRPTQVVVKPHRTFKAVGMGWLVQLGIGLVLGALLGVIACFMVELVGKVRSEGLGE